LKFYNFFWFVGFAGFAQKPVGVSVSQTFYTRSTLTAIVKVFAADFSQKTN